MAFSGLKSGDKIYVFEPGKFQVLEYVRRVENRDSFSIVYKCDKSSNGWFDVPWGKFYDQTIYQDGDVVYCSDRHTALVFVDQAIRQYSTILDKYKEIKESLSL